MIWNWDLTDDWHHSIGQMVFNRNGFKPTNYATNDAV